MTWIYQEYAEYPYISDIEKKGFRFGIEIGEDPVNIKLKKDSSHKGIVSVTSQGNGILRPRFYLGIGQNETSLYNLSFDLIWGMKSEFWKNGNVIIDGEEWRAVVRERTELGDFDDFKDLAEYAVRRMPYIAREVLIDPERIAEELDEDTFEEVEKFRSNCLEIADWDLTQREIIEHFTKTFSYYASGGMNIKGVSNSFKEEQKQRLLEMIKPLEDIL